VEVSQGDFIPVSTEYTNQNTQMGMEM